MPYDCTLKLGDVEKVSLGFGIEVPDGYAGYVFPRLGKKEEREGLGAPGNSNGK